MHVFQVRALRGQEHHKEGPTAPPPPALRDLSLAFAGTSNGPLSIFNQFLDYLKGAAVFDFGALRHMSLDLDYATIKQMASTLLPITPCKRPSVGTRRAIELLDRTRNALTPIFPLSTVLSVGVHPYCGATSRIPGGEQLAAFGRVQYVDEFVDDDTSDDDDDTSNRAGVAVIGGIMHSFMERRKMDIEWVECQFKENGATISCCSVRIGPGLVDTLANVDTLVLRCVRSMAATLAEQNGRLGYLLASYLAKCTRVRRVVIFAPTDAWDVHGEDEEDNYSAADRVAMSALEGNLEGDDELRRDDDGQMGDEGDEPEEKRIKLEGPKGDTAHANVFHYVNYFSGTPETGDLASAIFSLPEHKEAPASDGTNLTIDDIAPKTTTATPPPKADGITAVNEPAKCTVGRRYDRRPRALVDRSQPAWWVPLSRSADLTDDQLVGLASALGELRGLDTLEHRQKWFLCMVGRLHCPEDVYAAVLAKLPRVRTLCLACGERWRRTSLDMAVVAMLAKRVAQLLRSVADHLGGKGRKNSGKGNAIGTADRDRE